MIKNSRPKKSPRIEVIKNGCPKKLPRSLAVIKNGHLKKLACTSAVIKNGRPKKLACTSVVIKNDHPKKLAHFQDQAIIPRTFEKTFRRQLLRSRHKNTTIPEEESS